MTDPEERTPTVPPPKPAITLPMIYAAVMDFRGDVLEEFEKQRLERAEIETTLLQQGNLHRARLDGLDAKVGSIEAETQDHDQEILKLRRRYHDLANKLTPIVADLEDVKERLGVLERGGARDTEAAPPPDGHGG